MRTRVLVMGLICLLPPYFSGCAYLHDRGRDACDIVTVAVEDRTVNAAVQFGPLAAGVGRADGRGFGLRSGGVGVYDYSEANILCFGHREFQPRIADLDRGKGYEFDYLCIPVRRSRPDLKVHEGKWFNWFQFEAAIGCGVVLRVGFNLAEALDFVLGWATLDICGDDIAIPVAKEQRAFRQRKAADTRPPEEPVLKPLPRE